MSKFYMFLGAVMTAATSHAAASTVVDGKCVSVAAEAGCLFDGNINSNGNGNANSYVNAQNAYNLYNNTHPTANPDITLNVIGSSDDANFSTYGSITGASGSSGTWSLTGYVVNFVAVKAGDYFTLFQLGTPSNSGSWDTFDIPYKKNPKDLSHLVFFGSASPMTGVPEPATWALMMLGFGAVGGAMRRRQTIAANMRLA